MGAQMVREVASRLPMSPATHHHRYRASPGDLPRGREDRGGRRKPMALKRGIERAVEKAVEKLKELHRDVKGRHDRPRWAPFRQTMTSKSAASSPSDEEVGKDA